MSKNMYVLSLVILVALTSAAVLWRFPDYFEYGNSRVIEPWGDGYQAYHAYLYHIKNDTTYSHYAGMNYPFGDHVIPGNCQPLLSNAVKFLGLEHYALGIMHFSMLVSILLAAVFLWLIFMRLGLPGWVSVAAAIGIAFLSPQIHRMSTHYGLAHPEVVPVVFYLLLRWEEREDWRWALGLGLSIFIFAQIHFYFFAIMAFTITGYMGIRWLWRRDWKRLLRYALHYGLAVLLPFVFFSWWMNAGDPVNDRSGLPWGFFNYRAYPGGLLYSPFEPHWKWLGEHMLKLRHFDFEARNYIGLTAIAGLVLLVVALAKRRFDTVMPAEQPVDRRQWMIYTLVASAAILIFAFGVPFIIPGLEGLLNHTGPIRQFRSIGRFAWVFYYAVNIAAITAIYRVWGKKPLMMALPLAVLLFEAHAFAWDKDLRLDPIEEYEPGKRFTDLKEVNFAAYQSILPIPYFNLGSDQFWWDISGLVAQKSETISIQTGLPLSGSHLTRTSRSQTLKQLQLVTEPYRLPAILSDFPNKKPLLMAWDTIRHADFGQDFRHLLDGALLLYEKKEFRLYELPLESFQERINRKIASIQSSMSGDALSARDGWLLSDSTARFVYRSFDDKPSDHPYSGAGGFKGIMNELSTLYDGPLPGDSAQAYVFSAWMYIDGDLNTRSDMEIQLYNPTSGEVRQSARSQVKDKVKVFDTNGWALIEWPVRAEQPGSAIRWTFLNKDLGKNELLLDELLIRPAGLDVYKQLEKGVWWNDRYYTVDSRR